MDSRRVGRRQRSFARELPIRRRLTIRESDHLLIEETARGLLLRRVPDLTGLANVDAKYGTIEEAKRKSPSMARSLRKRDTSQGSRSSGP